MPAKSPVRDYAAEFLTKSGLSSSQASAIAVAIIAAQGTTDPVGSVYGDTVGALLGPLLVQGIHGTEITKALAADVDDYAPVDDSLILRIDFGGYAVTGMAAPDNTGEVRIIVAVTGGTLPHEDSGSTDINRWLCSGGTDVTLDDDGVAIVVYDGTSNRWRVISGGGGGSLVTTAVDVAATYLRRLGGGWAVVSVTAASGSSLTLDLSTANVFDITLTANCTIAFSNPPASGVEGSWTLILRQGGSGSYTVTWPAAVKWQSATGTNTGSAPTLWTAIGAQDVIVLVTEDGGTTYGAADESHAAVSPLTTKGDLYGRSSSADARLAVGTDGTFLMADSTAATGLSYALPRPLMVADTDGTHWNVLVDGDGNALMTY